MRLVRSPAGPEHFRRGDHLPAENGARRTRLVEASRVDLFDESRSRGIAASDARDRWCGARKAPNLRRAMGVLSGQLLLLIGLSRRLRAGNAPRQSPRALRPTRMVPLRAGDGSPPASGYRPKPPRSKISRRLAAYAAASPRPHSRDGAPWVRQQRHQFSREPRYRWEPEASKTISRRMSRLRVALLRGIQQSHQA